MSDRRYTLHITFDAFTDDEAVRVLQALGPLVGDRVSLDLTSGEDWAWFITD